MALSKRDHAKRSIFNVLGQLTSTIDAHGTGSAVTTAYAYTSHGDLAAVTVGGATVATLSYDPAGNRTQIVEPNTGTTQFAFNALGELTSTTDGKSQTSAYVYDLLGRLTTRTDHGGVVNTWTWDPAGDHGGISNTLSYDNNGNITQYAAASGPNTWLTYDARDNVTQIHVGPTTSTIAARDQFWYDTDDQRVQSLESWDESGTTRTRRVLYLGGDVEEVRAPTTSTHDRIVRLQVTATVRAIARRRASDQVWEAWYYEYAHRDHLGSVDAITNSAGAVQQKTSFDPFGGRRATSWNAELSATGLNALRTWQDSRGSRGFTDHEHLNRTGFIHMNGRVYDPRIGRFFTPDPIVQAPWFSRLRSLSRSIVQASGRCFQGGAVP